MAASADDDEIGLLDLGHSQERVGGRTRLENESKLGWRCNLLEAVSHRMTELYQNVFRGLRRCFCCGGCSRGVRRFEHANRVNGDNFGAEGQGRVDGPRQSLFGRR